MIEHINPYDWNNGLTQKPVTTVMDRFASDML